MTLAPDLQDRLALAASPTCLVMACLTSVLDPGAMATMCGGVGASWVSGMGAMYLLMGVFHAQPWLRRLRERRA